jgi:peptidyl-prolyl cis-trans isomerase SurA
MVNAVRGDIHIAVNPRYGVLDQNKVVAGSGGVVRLLSDAGNGAAGSSGN